MTPPRELMIALSLPKTFDPQEVIKEIYAHYTFRLEDELPPDGWVVIVQKENEKHKVTRQDLYADTLDPIRSKAKTLWGSVKAIKCEQQNNELVLYFEKIMTREEWYHSTQFIKLRFLGNMGAEMIQHTQQFNDVLELLLAENPELTVFDAFSLVEAQARIVNLEARKLWDRARKLADKLTPKLDDE